MKASYHKYTQEEKDFIKQNVDNISVKELTKKFNEHFNLDLRTNQIKRMKEHMHVLNNKRHNFTKIEKKFIEENWNKMSATNIARLFNNRFGANMSRRKILNYAEVHKLKTKDFTRPEGYEKLQKNRGSYQIKTKNGFVQKSRYIYEKHNGKLPEDYVVLFLYGNNKICDINNLCAVPKAYFHYLCTRGLFFKDKETNKTAIMSTDLLFKAKKRKKEVV